MAQASPFTKTSATPEPPRPSPHLPVPATAGVKRKRVTDQKYYGVKEGKSPGIYYTWDECLQQVKGHKGALFKAFPTLHEAQAFVEGRPTAQSPSTRPSGDPKFYGVQNGRVPGVYTDWPSAQAQIRGVRNPKHKKFSNRAEAEAYVAAGKKMSGYQWPTNLTSGEQAKRVMIQKSAPGLVVNGMFTPKDKEGNQFELGRGPLPPGAEDGFDPNVKLARDGTILRKTEQEKLKTKMITKEKDPPSMLRIYTDGSSLKNGQAGARAGVGVFFGPQDPKNVSEALKGSRQTNQRAELTAILRALEIAPRHRDITIYTDSKYAISCVTEWYKNWVRNKWLNSKGKPVENKDLIVDIRDQMEERDYLKRGTFFVWVKGHAGDEGNMAADRLAVAGAVAGRGLDEEESRRREIEAEVDEEDEIDGSEAEDEDPEAAAEAREVADAYRAMAEAMEEDDVSGNAYLHF